jgi:hypothetical protein
LKPVLALFLIAPIGAILFFSASRAQSFGGRVKTLVIKEGMEEVDLDPFSRYLIDTGKKHDAGQIAALDEGHWNRCPALPFNGGYLRDQVWVRLTIADSSAKGAQWYLSLMYSQLDTVELYYLEEGKPKLFARTGRLCPHRWPAISNRHPTFALLREILSENGTVLLRVRTADVCAISLKLFEGGYYQQSVESSTIIYGIYFGAIAAFAFFNLFLFFGARFVSCLWYSFWIMSFALYQASACGHWTLINGMPAWFLQNSAPLFAGACMVFGGLFSAQFLELKKFSPLLNRCYVFFECSCGLLLIGTFVDGGRPAAIGASAMSAIFVNITLVVGAVLIKRRGRGAVFYTGALLMLMVGILLNVGKNFGILPNIFITAQGTLLGSTFESILLAIALVDRIASIEKEKSYEREKARISEGLASESRLSALQAQINPHFLFNTLTTIADMAMENTEKAKKLIVKLSRLFRYTLGASLRKTVPLSAELDMVETYLSIEKMRFGTRLGYDIDIQGDPAKTLIMGMILQPIVENAIKHGISPLASGGTIRVLCKIETDTIYINVRDSGPGFGHSSTKDGTKHGLWNIEERLRLAYGKDATMSCSNDGGAVVEVFLPTLEAG